MAFTQRLNQIIARRPVRIALWSLGCLTSALFFLALVGGAYVLGGLMATGQMYGSRFREEEAVLRPVLESNRAFNKVQVKLGCSGHAHLAGSVADEEGRTQLREAVKKELGEYKLDRRMSVVEISGE